MNGKQSLQNFSNLKGSGLGAGALNSTFANSLRTLSLLMRNNSRAKNFVQKLFKKFLFDKVSTDFCDDIESWG